MSIEQAFLAGLELVRAAGLDARGKDVAVLAAHAVFTRASRGLESDPRFPAQAPLYAKRLILTAYTK